MTAIGKVSIQDTVLQRGRSRDDVTVAVTGGAVVVSVRRYEWLQLTVDFQA